jgi:Na+/melibiose symporter-like transporter
MVLYFSASLLCIGYELTSTEHKKIQIELEQKRDINSKLE